MTARLSALSYMTLDADTMDPIETRATSRLQTAFRRGDVWVASGGRRRLRGREREDRCGGATAENRDEGDSSVRSRFWRRREPERWEVQGFLLQTVTGEDHDIGYAPIVCSSESEADEWVRRLYHDHGPGMVRVDKRRLPCRGYR